VAEIEAPSPERISPADNLDGWIEAREKKKDAEAGQSAGKQDTLSAPAEPTVSKPEAPAQTTSGDWWESGLTDAKHGFLKGKKGDEVEKAFRHSETAKQAAERRANDLEKRLADFERERIADMAAARVVEQQRVVAPTVDPAEGIDQLWFENPKLAYAKIVEQARAEAAVEAAKARDEVQSGLQREKYLAAGNAAYEAARVALNLDEATWSKRAKAVYVDVTDPDSDYYKNYGPLNVENLVTSYRELYGEPAPQAAPIVLAPAPSQPDPPGSKRPAPPVRSEPSQSLLTAERKRALRQIADIAGLDPNSMIARAEQRRSRG
jgi:hypothetical protein